MGISPKASGDLVGSGKRSVGTQGVGRRTQVSLELREASQPACLFNDSLGRAGMGSLGEMLHFTAIMTYGHNR